jgi:hypothetical protein
MRMSDDGDAEKCGPETGECLGVNQSELFEGDACALGGGRHRFPRSRTQSSAGDFGRGT